MGKKEEEQPQAGYWASIAAGVAAAGVAAWGISRMLSDSQEKEDAMKIRSAAGPSRLLASSSNSIGMHHSYPIRLAPPSGRFTMIIGRTCRPHERPGGYKEDGSVMRGPSGYGGILVDRSGNWVQGFRGFIDNTDVTTIEFHGIYKGLLLLDKLGLDYSCLASDFEVHEWIDRENLIPRNSEVMKGCFEMVEKCRQLKTENNISLTTLCDANCKKYAHKLACVACEAKEPYKEFMDLPNEIREIIDRES